ncbi:MAG: MFS transporter [Elusimicrobiota bacterium]|nr:MAG: MFS transporter [Elusimicrobiota bacterium]
MRRDRLLAFFAVNYFAQGMGGLAYEPVSYYLKDALGLGPGQSAAFVAWMTLPLTVKPLFGVLTDFLPWAGSRRRPHLIAVSLVTSLGWLLLAGLKTANYGAALALLILVNVGFVLSDVVCDAVMVERGKERGLTGLYQAVSIGTLYATLIVTGLGGGWLAQHASYRTVFLLTALFPALTAASAWWLDEAGVGDLRSTAAKGLGGLKTMLGDGRSWAVALGIFLWSFCPFLGTAQFYYQSEAVKLSPVFIGGLATLGGFAGLAGAALFGRLTKEGTEKVVRASVWLGAPLSLLYLFYTGPVSIAALNVLFSLTGVVFRLAWMDLAAKTCPEGAEATAFAAYMAVFNIAASASNTLGGRWYEALTAAHGPYRAMALLSLVGTAGTLAAWPCLARALRRP